MFWLRRTSEPRQSEAWAHSAAVAHGASSHDSEHEPRLAHCALFVTFALALHTPTAQLPEFVSAGAGAQLPSVIWIESDDAKINVFENKKVYADR